MALELLLPTSDDDVVASSRELKQQRHVLVDQPRLESQRGVVYPNNVQRNILRDQNRQWLHEQQMHRAQEFPPLCEQL